MHVLYRVHYTQIHLVWWLAYEFYVHVTVHRNKFLYKKPTRRTNFTHLFCHETLHVSDSSFVHHQEFIHYTLSNGICHTCL
jgi:hypothetical protein